MIRVNIDCGFMLKALATKKASQELLLHEGER